MTIMTREVFLALEAGMRVSGGGDCWEVVYNRRNSNHPDVPGPREILLQRVADNYRLKCGWLDSVDRSSIVNQFFDAVFQEGEVTVAL